MEKELDVDTQTKQVSSIEPETDRRAFIKKVAYTAPKLIVLGYLAESEKVHADGTGGPSGPPGGWNPW